MTCSEVDYTTSVYILHLDHLIYAFSY